MANVFVISPVRLAEGDVKEFLIAYKKKLEGEGYNVHLPLSDTPQTPDKYNLPESCLEYEICKINRQAIKNSDQVHILYNPSSRGSLFDIGMTFMTLISEKKGIFVINPSRKTEHKSFDNFLLYLQQRFGVEEEKKLRKIADVLAKESLTPESRKKYNFV